MYSYLCHNIVPFYILPFFGLQILFYKLWTKNKDFSSVTFIIFGIISYAFFISQKIMITFILWEFITWISYLLLKSKNNRSEVKIILINNIIGGLAFAWATCILIQQCKYWSDLSNVSFNNSQILQLNISLAITILTKSSQFPFSWLTLTEKSSSLVSAYLHSSTVVQLGMYLIMQLLNTDINNHLFKLILITSSTITIIISFLQCKTKNIKTLIALTSQTHISLCIVTILCNDIRLIKYMIFSHAIYKSALFVVCDYFMKKHKTYSLENISIIPSSIFIILIAAAIPMCSVGAYITNLSSKINLLTGVMVKIINFIVCIQIFQQIRTVSKFYLPHILFLPILFLIPHSIAIKPICYFAAIGVISFALYNFKSLFIKVSINIAKSIYNLLNKVNAPKNEISIYISLAIFICYFTHKLHVSYFIPEIKANALYLFILMVGCISILQNSKASILIGLNLISLCVTSFYIKHGGVDIAVTNILVDIIITYLIIKSGLEFKNNKFNFIHFFIAICISLILCSMFLKCSYGIIYPHGTIVNDVVVFYRLLDTLGETLVFFVLALCIKSR